MGSITKIAVRCFGIFLVFFFVPITKAETYFLKFETSGSTPASTNVNSLTSDPNAWIKLSIVTVPGADGNVHWPNSQVGATVGSGNENNKVFYLANVPRSLRIVSSDGTSNRVVTAGADVEQFDNAPSFLLSDGFLVATGLGSNIYIAAYPGLRPTPLEDIACSEGWFHESEKVKIVESSVSLIKNPTNYYEGRFRCSYETRYRGNLPYAVLFE